MRRLNVLKTREILRLKYEIGLSLREIGKACNCGKSTVSEVLDRAEKAGITWPIDMGDKQLMSLLYPPINNKNAPPEPDMEYVFYEMRKKGVTLMLLWEEYKERHPGGIMYTQFCDRYRNFKKSNEIQMHIEHKAGEEMQVDWAGQTMPYIDKHTGEIKNAFVFVAVLPASAYPFVYAYDDTALPNWLDAHVRAFEYFGGVPKVIIPDNTKTAVSKPDLFDPVVNKSYNEMAMHYRAIVIPARSGRPKDKAADENMVGNVSRRVCAVLRNRQFFSIAELNEAIEEAVEKLIDRPFQKMPDNRCVAFEKIDKPCLQPLPATRYEYAVWKEAKVQFNYHVEYDGFFYSVPYSYAGKKCSIRATVKTIEVYVGSERIAAFRRNNNSFKRYTTLPEHMPEAHKAVSAWNTERFLAWAEKIGSNTRMFINRLLESREYPVQTYRSCMGIMRFSQNYSNEIMESACKEAISKQIYTYKYFSIIIKQVASNYHKEQRESIVKHDNVRGSNAYTGGGIRV